MLHMSFQSMARHRGQRRCACHHAACPTEMLASGAVATGADVVEQLRDHGGQPVSKLARWIVERQVAVFSCGAGLLLPLFQFDFARGSVRSGVGPVIATLSGVMGDNDVTRWFLLPNRWLQGAAPADAFATDVPGVLAAALADRSAATACQQAT